ncbi:phosphoenolpyruvate hydrolase family protein [Bosea sp. (in: a-proteobacteria)]|uniref:phosphoenolpyruvate hydrolase family protein n=1 Tax=Bosea sp. (in: a-proteobacteria) TaxID=1871050 RepID=UPI002632FD31|nr:phosphoenolpyruvate hydrolase family protein [Bosea sp. (in: a-proteobacteria)]MCO5090608.1 phosphoenolpyruvate hydrolase family protein [Bosea sp. (in: a-proteobacteria)]
MSRTISAPSTDRNAGAPAPLGPGSQRDQPRFIVGAAIGTGMAAQSATRGGADFLIALSAGRMRCIGEPSVAAMLPLRDSNEFVLSFARSEILPRATVPVYFGAASFDPRLDLRELVERIARAGFAGIANFPTSILIDGQYRAFLERSGVGFGRELELLAVARERGLSTLAYTHTAEEAAEAARQGADIVNIDLGWNVGGVLGAVSHLRVEDAGLMVNAIARQVRAVSRKTRCLVEGGPIVSPRQLEELCQIARVDGYIGGSTIDRVPSESAIEVVTAAFKAIGVRQKADGLDARFNPRRFPRPLWGHSQAAETARALFNRLMSTDYPVVIAGEPGSGRREIARALHRFGPRQARDMVSLPCANQGAERLRLDLFGCMAGMHPSAVKHRLGWLEIVHASSLMLDDVEEMPPEVQRALLDAVEAGSFWRHGGETPSPLNVRFLAVARQDLRHLPDEKVDPRFAEWLGCFTIVLPPLRERSEDLPSLIDESLRIIANRRQGEPKSLDPAAYRLLSAHHWPGNLRELDSVLEQAVLACPSGVILEQHLPPLGAEAAAAPRHFSSEKEWILHGLKKNRFRRSQTADYLGISRKTLYNKMRAYGLQSAAGPEGE